MGNDPLAAFRRERWQRNDMELEQGSKPDKTDQVQEPLTEHQALRLAIDALNQVPNYRLMSGEHRATYDLIPLLEGAYERGKTTEKLRDAAPDMLDTLKSNSSAFYMIWDLVADSPDEEAIRAEVQAQLDKINDATAKAKPEPAPEQKTREIDIEPER